MLSDIKLKQFDNNPLGNKGKKDRIHPHKFIMWVAISSIIMMFAGLTSAYIVKANLAGWQQIQLPKIFWLSTAAIIASSVTIQMALRSFKQRAMQQYRTLMTVTLVLGALFVLFQWIGFNQLWNQGIHFNGAGAGQFLYVIAGLHALHVTGGVIALLVMVLKAYFGKVKNYDPVPVEVVSTYWHFVDILWLYLLIFFIWIG